MTPAPYSYTGTCQAHEEYTARVYRARVAGPMQLNDLMSEASLRPDRGEMVSKWLYLDLPPWGYHVFEMKSV